MREPRTGETIFFIEAEGSRVKADKAAGFRAAWDIPELENG